MKLVWQKRPVLADTASPALAVTSRTSLFFHIRHYNQVTLKVTQRYVQMKEHILILCHMLLNELSDKTYRQLDTRPVHK